MPLEKLNTDQTKPRKVGMNNIGQPERATQNRFIALFLDELHYRYLGDWQDREGNSNIEEGLLISYLTGNGYSHAQINSAVTNCALRRTTTYWCVLTTADSRH
jgi:hypothetical protein